MNVPNGSDNRAKGHFVLLLFLLWTTGAATRFSLLAVPPLLPMVRDDLQLSETQVGLLFTLPVILFALAAVPGSLLVARIGVRTTVVLGLLITALASAARGLTPDITTLYLATMVMGFGIAVVQPALPQLVQQWMPRRLALGTAVYTNGNLIATTTSAALTIPIVLPAVGMNWRYALVAWSAVVLVIALLFLFLAPRDKTVAIAERAGSVAARWPDWKSPVIWLLGITLAANSSIFFGINAFVPDYLAAHGRKDLISAALGWVNGGQLIASFVLLAFGQRLLRRAWPFVVFGIVAFLCLVGIMFSSDSAVVVLVACMGFSTSISFVVLLALPAVLSAPQDVHRTAAGMFTISFTGAIIIPTLSGAIWDLTGAPWGALVPLAACALVLVVGGPLLVRLKPYSP